MKVSKALNEGHLIVSSLYYKNAQVAMILKQRSGVEPVDYTGLSRREIRKLNEEKAVRASQLNSSTKSYIHHVNKDRFEENFPDLMKHVKPEYNELDERLDSLNILANDIFSALGLENQKISIIETVDIREVYEEFASYRNQLDDDELFNEWIFKTILKRSGRDANGDAHFLFRDDKPIYRFPVLEPVSSEFGDELIDYNLRVDIDWTPGQDLSEVETISKEDYLKMIRGEEEVVQLPTKPVNKA